MIRAIVSLLLSFVFGSVVHACEEVVFGGESAQTFAMTVSRPDVEPWFDLFCIATDPGTLTGSVLAFGENAGLKLVIDGEVFDTHFGPLLGTEMSNHLLEISAVNPMITGGGYNIQLTWAPMALIPELGTGVMLPSGLFALVLILYCRRRAGSKS